MPRYFIEVSYNGRRYSGFQVQQNAITIQSEVEKALSICFRQPFELTGASRTDAGVHALQNFFHFDTINELTSGTYKLISKENNLERALYSLNSILPQDIVIKTIIKVRDDAHSRFDAVSREYKYYLYRKRNPFYRDNAYFYPFKIDIEILKTAAEIILHTKEFTSFSKKNTQVDNFFCTIYKSEWCIENDLLIYNVLGNRFLRGMVKGLVGTMLRAGRGKISLDEFDKIIKSRDCTKADFSVPAHGLFLIKVEYGDGLMS